MLSLWINYWQQDSPSILSNSTQFHKILSFFTIQILVSTILLMSSESPCFIFSIQLNIQKPHQTKHLSKLMWKLLSFSAISCTQIVHCGLSPVNLSHDWRIIVNFSGLVLRIEYRLRVSCIHTSPGSLTIVNNRWYNHLILIHPRSKTGKETPMHCPGVPRPFFYPRQWHTSGMLAL